MSAEECAAYNAPFPDAGHRAALRAFPPMVPEFVDSDGAAASRDARDFWQSRWDGKTFMAIGEQDPVLGTPVMRALQQVRVSPSLSVARPHSALSSLALPTMRTGRAATRP
jgi:tRNA(adenine34) deaminase